MELRTEDKQQIRESIQSKYTHVAQSPEGRFQYPTGRKGLMELRLVLEAFGYMLRTAVVPPRDAKGRTKDWHVRSPRVGNGSLRTASTWLLGPNPLIKQEDIIIKANVLLASA
ncbi:MAG: hypothetical protein V5A14_00670 [Desulfohalobiaceae bacterium]